MSEIWDFDKPFVFNEQFFQSLTGIIDFKVLNTDGNNKN